MHYVHVAVVNKCIIQVDVRGAVIRPTSVNIVSIMHVLTTKCRMVYVDEYCRFTCNLDRYGCF